MFEVCALLSLKQRVSYLPQLSFGSSQCTKGHRYLPSKSINVLTWLKVRIPWAYMRADSDSSLIACISWDHQPEGCTAAAVVPLLRQRSKQILVTFKHNGYVELEILSKCHLQVSSQCFHLFVSHRRQRLFLHRRLLYSLSLLILVVSDYIPKKVGNRGMIHSNTTHSESGQSNWVSNYNLYQTRSQCHWSSLTCK